MASEREEALKQRIAAMNKERQDKLKQFNARRDMIIDQMKMSNNGSIRPHSAKFASMQSKLDEQRKKLALAQLKTEAALKAALEKGSRKHA